MGPETGDTNYVNHYKQPLNIIIDKNGLHVDIVIDETGLHVKGYKPHLEVRGGFSLFNDVTYLKNGCLIGYYETSGVKNKDEFHHVLELLSRVLELEKNLDELIKIIQNIAQNSLEIYQQDFKELEKKLSEYYFTLIQPSPKISHQVDDCSHQVQDLLDA